MIGNEDLGVLLDELGGYFPVMVVGRLAICAVIRDLYQEESAMLILKEIANEVVEGTLVLGVDIHLGEDLVDVVDGVDRARI